MMEFLSTEKNNCGFSMLSTSHSTHLAAWLFFLNSFVNCQNTGFFKKVSSLFKWDSKYFLL